jgi:hypothetical protein
VNRKEYLFWYLENGAEVMEDGPFSVEVVQLNRKMR